MAENEVRCPKCDSSHNYYRKKTDDHVCQKCGNVWSKGKKVKA